MLVWSAGGYIISEEDVTLIAQWTTLDTLKLPEDLTEIGDEALAGIGAEFIQIPDGCGSIGNYAFRNCTDLKQIRISDGCTIGLEAFDNCENVTIFGTEGSPAYEYCTTHDNCKFIKE